MAAVFALCGGFALAACQWLIYFYSPVEMQLGLIQKIFYLHLPLAWWALLSFFVNFTASILFLWRRKKGYDNLATASAEIGVLFSGLALVSGMIWARQSWGVWWTWDPRLSTTLVMWFIYAAYLILRQMESPNTDVICAVVGVTAFLDVPLVFFSARIFRSIHPAVFAARGGGLDSEMKLTVMGCICALGLLWGAILIFRKRQLDMMARAHQYFMDRQ